MVYKTLLFLLLAVQVVNGQIYFKRPQYNILVPSNQLLYRIDKLDTEKAFLREIQKFNNIELEKINIEVDRINKLDRLEERERTNRIVDQLFDKKRSYDVMQDYKDHPNESTGQRLERRMKEIDRGIY